MSTHDGRPGMRIASILAVCALPLMGFPCEDPDPGVAVWPAWGGDLHNTHHAAAETTIRPSNVHRLQPKWTFRTTGNVSAIPTLSETRVYVPDWGLPYVGGSRLFAIDRDTGEEIFKKKVTDYTGNLIHNVARSSPAIAGDLLVFGDLRNQPSAVADIPGGHGATLYAVDRTNGALVWKTTLDHHPLSVVTQSPVFYEGRIYVGVSSLEEAAARLPYDCCTFRGSMLALEASTGNILWRRYMTPDPEGPNGDFTGVAVWGSAPTIDEERRSVYIATGNNYTLSDALTTCLADHRGDPEAQSECYAQFDAPDNYAESVLALDLDTGAVKWARKLQNFGAWTFACDPDLIPAVPVYAPNCEDLDGLDYDFGQSPMLVRTEVAGVEQDLLGVGQKSGVFWAFDPDDGSTIWATRVGPGGVLGGMEFGAASDGERFYVQITNFDHTPFELVAGERQGEVVNGGIWAALDASDGTMLWQTPDPSSELPLDGHMSHLTWGSGLGAGFFGVAMGPMTVANGVVFAGSMDEKGHMYAMDARNGTILWSFESGGSVMSAPSIADGVLYWGSGYSTGFNNNKLYAFEIGDP